MFTQQNLVREAHQKIDHIFKSLFPKYGMSERTEQIRLAHRILDAMLNNHISLSDAGTGIGKTYAYLVAGTLFLRYRAACELAFQPIIISTSSIALQSAVKNEYLPFLSDLMMENGFTKRPIRAVIRKGKSHYVCDRRLKRRLNRIDFSKKNPVASAALRSLCKCLDMDEASHLSKYDRERVSVPKACDCNDPDCRYRRFLEHCDAGRYPFQICNHNLFLADAIHRHDGRRPILPDSCAVILDEAHKLPEAARQMFGEVLEPDSIKEFLDTLKKERFILAAETLAKLSAPLLEEMTKPFCEDTPVEQYVRLLVMPTRYLLVMKEKIGHLLSPTGKQQLNALTSTVMTIYEERGNMIRYTEQNDCGGTNLCTTVSNLDEQLQCTLWNQPRPFLLTSGTLAVGSDFHRFKMESGLADDERVTETVAPSPFDYRKNCLLYLPKSPPRFQTNDYFDALADEIAKLLQASHGHGLVLFTSYAAMSIVKDRLVKKKLPWPLIAMGRNAVHTTEHFRDQPGSVLLATGAAWEGLDFSGDSVSMLIIPRLPFAHPDAISENERKKYPTLRDFIRSVVTPAMQIKLRQGFGRAIRTEHDTCAVAILDERAVCGARYFGDMRTALPDMQITRNLCDVQTFMRQVKTEDYFLAG